MNKIFLLVLLAFSLCAFVFPAEADDQALLDAVSELQAQAEVEEEESEFVYPNREKIFPDAKRPKSYSAEQIDEALQKNIDHATDEYVKSTEEAFKFGLESKIVEILQEIKDNKDPRFVNAVYDLFQETKSNGVREKILNYFAALEDPCLEDYAVDIVNDPYGKKSNLVEASFNYVSKVKSQSALPGLVEIIAKEEEEFFLKALVAIGEVGGSDEARFLAQFMERADLNLPERQALVKVLGKLKAVETYDKMASLAEDQNENSHVRMYCAEAIGQMGKSEAEDLLIDLYEDEDPNFRAYVIKGLSNFSDDRAHKVIEQALRDSHYKVRLEAISTVEKQGISSAVPYLVYRCKDTKEEKVVRDKCCKVLAKLNSSEGNEYLIGVLKDPKASDVHKAQVAAALLENGSGISDVMELAKSTLQNGKHLSLRYALGKEFAKYGSPEFAELCAQYIESTDPATQGTGLDIFAKGKYSSVMQAVRDLAQPAYDEAAEKEAKEKALLEGDESNAKPDATEKKKTRVVNQNSRKAKKILDYIGG